MPRLRRMQHERFARLIAELVPLATAYAEAGYQGDPRWHRYNASKLANRPAVKARIDKLRAQFEKMSGIHVDYVRHCLLRIIEADPRELYGPDPSDPTGKRQRLRSVEELPGRVSRAIQRIKVDGSGAPTEVIFAGKVEASATLLRSLPGGVVERREISGQDGGTVTLEMLVGASYQNAPAVKPID